MKTMYKYILSAIFMLMAGQTLQAQDAFYVYRNDGDFDGFFYDEVIRMGYSKFDLDSIEYDAYVVQEIETKDSLYRIPLAAIDSIGFQQPEIRFNPRFKNMDELGITPYITSTRRFSSDDCLGISKTIPDELMPNVGDVVASFDSNRFPNGYVVKITAISNRIFPQLGENDESVYFDVEYVSQLSDIFDQYITVEDLGYDEQGNLVRRRVAGMSHREKGETGNINLIHLQGTIQREWKPDENASISLAADMDIVFRVRLAYNIGWTRFFIKLTEELIIDATPSVSTSVSRGFDVALGNTVAGFGIPLRIWFPTECPIFELAPYPDWFIRGEGKLEAKFNFPKIHVGFGGDIIFDTNRLFPVDFGLHWIPEEDKSNKDLIDIGSTNVSLSGFLQTGLKFQVNIGTARWFQKLFSCQLGANIYAGPTIGGALEFSTDWLNNEGFGLYNILSNSSINASWLSLNVNAGTTASVLRGDVLNKTFYSANYPFFCDTLRLIPRLTPEVMITDNNVRVILHSRHDIALAYYKFKVYIKDYKDNIIHVIGDWIYKKDEDMYSGTCSIKDLKAGSYKLCMIPTWAGHELTEQTLNGFSVPLVVSEVSDTAWVFSPTTAKEHRIRFTTNADKSNIRGEGSASWTSPSNLDYGKIMELAFTSSAIDEDKGIYEAVYTMPSDYKFNLFPRKGGARLYVGDPGEDVVVQSFTYDLEGVTDLSDYNIGFYTYYGSVRASLLSEVCDSGLDDDIFPSGSIIGGIPFTMTRNGDNQIIVNGHREYSDSGLSFHCNLSFVINMDTDGVVQIDDIAYDMKMTRDYTGTHVYNNITYTDSYHHEIEMSGTAGPSSGVHEKFFGKNERIPASGKITLTRTKNGEVTANYTEDIEYIRLNMVQK